jgi:Dyp-type peroxidase family
MPEAKSIAEQTSVPLDLQDIQSGVLRPRPAPYAATYILLRINDRKAGRELMRRATNLVASAVNPSSPAGDAWISVALTFQGLKALGVPQASLDSFAPEFQEGMAARARQLGDIGESAPECWEKPLGTRDVHVVLTAVAPKAELLESVLERGRNAYQQLFGLEVIWRQECHALPSEKEHFGFRDGISHPAVEGSGIPASNPGEQPLKPGEFVLGYRDETGGFPPMPEPEVLGRNGTYAVFRKLHQRVAMFRQYLRANSSTPQEEELLAAKMMGRWRSGAPLALSPDKDDPELGANPILNNDFLFADDPLGLKTPTGSHIRRTNPRDASVAGAVRLHRMIRRGTAYGPPLPEGVLEDDGADRGIMFLFIGSHIKRQFEFVQSEWVNDSTFIGASIEKDPVAGANDSAGVFTIPRRPIRRRLQALPRFVVTRGGEYCFIPGVRALRWLADLN